MQVSAATPLLRIGNVDPQTVYTYMLCVRGHPGVTAYFPVVDGLAIQSSPKRFFGLFEFRPCRQDYWPAVNACIRYCAAPHLHRQPCPGCLAVALHIRANNPKLQLRHLNHKDRNVLARGMWSLA